MVKIKNLHPGILVVRTARGQVLEMQPEAVHFIDEAQITGSASAIKLIEAKKLKLVRSGR